MNSVKYKSRATSFFLTFFLGPLGLFYVSPAAAIIVLILFLVTASTVVVPVLLWIASMVISDSMCESHNRDADKLREIIESCRHD